MDAGWEMFVCTCVNHIEGTNVCSHILGTSIWEQKAGPHKKVITLFLFFEGRIGVKHVVVKSKPVQYPPNLSIH